MTCPICARETNVKYRPFCSRRCADVDLGRWITGKYAIPADAEEEDQRQAEDAPKARPQ